MTYNEFLVFASTKMVKNYRFGQCLFNTLFEVNPALADSTRGGKLDPFYDDSNIPAFLTFVEANWK